MCISEKQTQLDLSKLSNSQTIINLPILKHISLAYFE